MQHLMSFTYKQSLCQLGAKMSQWRLYTYRTSNPNRQCVPGFSSSVDMDSGAALNITPRQNSVFHQKYKRIEPSSMYSVNSETHSAVLKCHTSLYSGDERGNFVPNWSAFLTRAAQGDSVAMKTVCILARSQRFSYSQNDYLLYQNVIEAVRAEMTSPDILSLQRSVMVFYAILALAIQASVMSGLCLQNPADQLPRSEAGLHLDAARTMLGYINRMIQQYDGSDVIKRLVDFENVVSYLLAVTGSSAKAPAWPLLMYHLIVD